MKKIILILFAVFFLFTAISFAQEKPTFKQGVIYLTKFICSDYFVSLKNKTTDLDLVDTLYLRSLKYYLNDPSEAMLALTFATLPYTEIHITIPLIQLKFTVPLPTVRGQLFTVKMKNLPAKFFYDTPNNAFGDKDKIPHFFGSAFIEYNIPYLNLSRFIGIFVEKFEEVFYVDGQADLRDLYVNGLGIKFGKALRKNDKLLPSEILKTYSFKIK